jgi:hypothetical protein
LGFGKNSVSNHSNLPPAAKPTKAPIHRVANIAPHTAFLIFQNFDRARCEELRIWHREREENNNLIEMFASVLQPLEGVIG